MTEVLAEVGRGITMFAGKIERKCGMEFEEAQQRLMIKAWEISIEYEPEIHLFGFAKYAMTMLHFETWHIIQEEARAHKMRLKALKRLVEKEQVETPNDMIQLITDRIAYQQVVALVPETDRKIFNLRIAGYTYREIAEKMHRSTTWVHQHLDQNHVEEKVQIAVNKQLSFV